MIYQRSPGMPKAIREYGCYFMALGEAAAKRNTSHLYTVKDFIAVYEKSIESGWMSEDCFIYDPAAILMAFGLKAEFVGKFHSFDRVCGDGEFEIVHYKYAPRNWDHFGGGNGMGFWTYDPWGVSITFTQGQFHSKRVFREIA